MQPDPLVEAWLRLLSLPRDLLILLVRGYRLLLKPWLGNACRFEPTCSAYALASLQRHGALAGATLAAGRLLRCHPWCKGGHDPAPAAPPRLFTRLGLASPEDPPVPTRDPR
jgi:uncharacterized protein